MALDATKTINGSFGTCWHEGNWMTNVTGVEANIEIDKEEVKRAGTRWVGHKTMALTGTGTVSSYKITSQFAKLIAQVTDDTKAPYTTELIVKLADPESYGVERVRLKGVQFDTIPLVNYEVGSIVEEELPFTFAGFEYLDEITAQ